MKAEKNTVHLAHVNEILKESKGDLYLDWRITLLMVMYFEVLWVLLSENVMA